MIHRVTKYRDAFQSLPCGKDICHHSNGIKFMYGMNTLSCPRGNRAMEISTSSVCVTANDLIYQHKDAK